MSNVTINNKKTLKLTIPWLLCSIVYLILYNLSIFPDVMLFKVLNVTSWIIVWFYVVVVVIAVIFLVSLLVVVAVLGLAARRGKL